MSNKRIDQLPASDNQVQGTDKIPVFSDGRTERITVDELGTYIGSSVDTYVTGATYSNGTLTLGRNDGVDLTVSGLYTGGTDTYVNNGVYSSTASTITFTNTNGGSFEVSGVTSGGYTPPYKVYTALISQTLSDAPVIEHVLENTLGFTPSWFRFGVGRFGVIDAGKYPTDKVAVFVTSAHGNMANIQTDTGITNDEIGFFVKDENGNNVDGRVSFATVEIRIYN